MTGREILNKLLAMPSDVLDESFIVFTSGHDTYAFVGGVEACADDDGIVHPMAQLTGETPIDD